MKLTFNRVKLLDGLKAALACVPNRSPKPVLMNAKLRATKTDAGVELAGTDLEQYIQRRVAEVDVEEEGSCLVNAARFAAVVGSCTDEVLTVRHDAGSPSVQIVGAQSSFKLVSEELVDFPDMPKLPEAGFPQHPGESLWKVQCAALRQAIRLTVFSCDVQNTRYALNGVAFETIGQKARLVATDGRRLSCVDLAAQRVGDPEVDLAGKIVSSVVVLPTRAMEIIEKAMPEDGEATIAIQANRAFVTVDGITVCTRLVEGRFPSYREILPSRHELRVGLPIGDLLAKLHQACLTTSEDARGVDLDFVAGDGSAGDKCGRLLLSSSSSEIGESEIVLHGQPGGMVIDKSMDLTIDPRYLIDALRVLPADEAIRCDLIDHQSVIVFTAERHGFTYAVMPLSREDR